MGVERIVRRLGEAGVDRELIDRTLAGHGREEELEGALQLLRRRFPDPPSDPGDRQRALAVLLRKGYGVELAADALRSYERESTAA